MNVQSSTKTSSRRAQQIHHTIIPILRERGRLGAREPCIILDCRRKCFASNRYRQNTFFLWVFVVVFVKEPQSFYMFDDDDDDDDDGTVVARMLF